jgi:hypothetical protein
MSGAEYAGMAVNALDRAMDARDRHLRTGGNLTDLAQIEATIASAYAALAIWAQGEQPEPTGA